MKENESPSSKEKSGHCSDEKNCRCTKHGKCGKTIVWLALITVGTLGVLAASSCFMS